MNTPDGGLTVGLLQTAPRYGHVDDNLAKITMARDQLGEVDLAVSAELSATGYGFDAHHPDWLLTSQDPRLAALPANTGVGYAEPGPRLPYNAYTFTGGTAGTQVVQHKLHPVSYAPWNEHLSFTPGEGLRLANVAGARVATLICNDMWHPVMPWYAVHAGAEVIVAPVASLEGRNVQQNWATILQHTARLLQVFVVFVNRCGLDNGETFWGGSRVIGPEGDTVVQLGAQPATATARLDLPRLRKLRRAVPILQETRPDLVATLLAELPSGPRS